MSKRAWLWLGAAVLVYLAIAQLLNTLLALLYQALNFTAPTTFVFGAPSPLLALIALVFNIVGEEFWWREYILPRQEAYFGRWARLAQLHSPFQNIPPNVTFGWRHYNPFAAKLIFKYISPANKVKKGYKTAWKAGRVD